MEFKELDPILHSQLRLAVVSLLISVREAEFTFLKEKTNSTAGNLSVQINKLKDAGYIEVTKQFSNNYPQTICKVTKKGIESFEAYVNALQSYMNPGKEWCQTEFYFMAMCVGWNSTKLSVQASGTCGWIAGKNSIGIILS